MVVVIEMAGIESGGDGNSDDDDCGLGEAGKDGGVEGESFVGGMLAVARTVVLVVRWCVCNDLDSGCDSLFVSEGGGEGEDGTVIKRLLEKKICRPRDDMYEPKVCCTS